MEITKSGRARQTTKRPHRKVKTGCKTCKSRRVRCDENFPACNRCVSTGRICAGYGIWGGGGTVPPDASPTSVIPVPGPCLSSEEQNHLEWIVRGASTISPCLFASPFWPPVLLQAAAESPMVLQSMLALSSVFKRKFLDYSNRAREDLPPDTQEIFTIKQCNGAMSKMRNQLHSGGQLDRTQLLFVTLACAVLGLMEGFRSEYDTAYIHMTSGIRLLKRLAEVTSDDYVDTHELRLFDRVQGQISLWRDPTGSPTTAPRTAIVAFKSSTEAKLALEAIAEEVVFVNNKAQSLQNYSRGVRVMMRRDITFYLFAYDAWRIAMAKTMAARSQPMPADEERVWEALRQQYSATRVFAQKVHELAFAPGERQVRAVSE